MRKLCAALMVAALFGSALTKPLGVAAAHAGHSRRHVSTSRHAHRRTRQSARPREVSYVCPMHADMRSATPGACPKCRMTLIAERRGMKGARGLHVDGGEAAPDETRPNP